jgi:hypothetical protein
MQFNKKRKYRGKNKEELKRMDDRDFKRLKKEVEQVC